MKGGKGQKRTVEKKNGKILKKFEKCLDKKAQEAYSMDCRC